MKRLGIFTALALMFLVGTGQMLPSGGGSSGSVERMLGIDDPQSTAGSAWPHSFTYEEYTTSRPFPKKGAVVLCFDDGDSTFLSEVVAISDSIYTASGVRIRASVGLMPTNTTEVRTGRNLTTAEVLQINAYGQDVFELACHGPNTERLGPTGLDNTGDQVVYGGYTGQSWAYQNAVFGGYQDSASSWGIIGFRSWFSSNWQKNLAANATYRDNGILQCKQQANFVTLSFDPWTQMHGSGARASWTGQTAMVRNTDPYIPASFDSTGQEHTGFQSVGGIVDPYDIGSCTSWDSSQATGHLDVALECIDMAAHMNGIWIKTFHQVDPTITIGEYGTNGHIVIRPDTLVAIMDHIKVRVLAGEIESLTFEQAAARMRGYLVGDVLQARGFRNLQEDGPGTTLATVNSPFGFPNDNDFYISTSDDFTTPTTGTNNEWKVMDLSADDVVADAFALRANYSDSTTYGVADTSRNVLHHEVNNVAFGRALGVTVKVTDPLPKRYLQLTAQCMVVTSPGASWGSGWALHCKGGAFEEVYYDALNATGASYDAMADLIGGRNGGHVWADLEGCRVRPQFQMAYADTALLEGSILTPSAGGTSHADSMAQYDQWAYQYFTATPLSFMSLCPNNGLDRHVTTGYLGEDGDTQATAWITPGPAGDDWEDQIHTWTDYGQPYQYVWYIPIDARTDFVHAQIIPQRVTSSFTSVAEVIITNMEAQIIR